MDETSGPYTTGPWGPKAWSPWQMSKVQFVNYKQVMVVDLLATHVANLVGFYLTDQEPA